MEAQPVWPITIVGPGAIGLHLALSLAPDHAVELRHPTREGSVDIGSANRGRRVVTCRRLTDPTPVHAAIVTTKAHQVVAAMRGIGPVLARDADILLVHNGLGPQQAVAENLLPGQRLGVAVSSEAVRRIDYTTIAETGHGETWIGPWSGCRAPGHLERALLGCELATHWEPQADALHRQVWQKLLVNAAINPLTALLDISNGELATPEHKRRWRALVPELVAIANAAGYPFTENELSNRITSVIQATAANLSSMHQDLARGRTPELQAITGILLRRADECHLHAPVLAEVHRATRDRFERRGIVT